MCLSILDQMALAEPIDPTWRVALGQACRVRAHSACFMIKMRVVPLRRLLDSSFY
jgi:hypothetical protein